MLFKCYNVGDFMSYEEYIDLFVGSQETGIYHMYTFDIVKSREMDVVLRQASQEKLVVLMEKMYQELENLEIALNRKILVKEDTINRFNNLPEPFLYGDAIGFTVYRDSISREIIIDLFEKICNELNIDFSFHISDGYYETNKYEEGGELFFRGYAFSIISNLHKNRIQKLIKKFHE